MAMIEAESDTMTQARPWYALYYIMNRPGHELSHKTIRGGFPRLGYGRDQYSRNYTPPSQQPQRP